MPNHVGQRLTVAGTRNDVAAFVTTARGASPATGDPPSSWNRNDKIQVVPLCFHMIAPLPDAFSEHPYGDDKSVGYNAEADGWSVKWGPYNIADDEPRLSDVHGTSCAQYDFMCAWGPPVEALRRASLRYPSLRFFLSWGGEGPCRGRHSFRRGKVELSIEDDYRRDMAHEMPTEDEYETDEDAARRRVEAVERKYIDSHDTWVGAELMAAASAAQRCDPFEAIAEQRRRTTAGGA